jgi:asparagine synthase (glutamine-hydrolysing)
MCGIVGVLNFKNKPVIHSQMSKLTNAIAHRGMDSDGILIGKDDESSNFKYPGIGLGHRRLSIIDLNPASSQPMKNFEQDLCIVYNGELYNYQSIKIELVAKGYKFKTESDTEVLLVAYQHWGTDCLNKFNGMFSFAIWDENKQCLFCARDHIGIKPFYYSINNSAFSFASESRAMKFQDNSELSTDALKAYLFSMYIPGDISMYQGIKKLAPGHYIIVDTKGNFKIEKYWSLPNSHQNSISSDDAIDLMEKQFNESVKMQLISDVPVGAFLSGGFDSGMLVATASKYTNTLHTYTVGFNDGKQFSELEIAKSMSKRYGTVHHERIIKSEEVIGILDKSILSMSEPVADSAMVPTYCLSQMAAEDGVKVLLSGTGGDEIFGGYSRYVGYNYKRALFLSIPKLVRKILGNSIFKNKVIGERLLSPPLDMLMSTGGAPDLLKSMFLNENELVVYIKKMMHSILKSKISNKELLYEHMFFDLQVYLPDLLLMLMDQLTMAHTIEGRVPFLDINLISTSLSLNPIYHAKGNQTRILQRRMAKSKVDERTFSAKKQGFSGPVPHWIDSNFNQFTEKIMAIREIPGLEKLPVEKICKSGITSENQFWHNDIFSLYCLSVWYQGNVKQ